MSSATVRRLGLGIIAVAMASALLVTLPDGRAYAGAAAPGPSYLPYIGPDGVSMVEQPDGSKKTNPIKDIKTGWNVSGAAKIPSGWMGALSFGGLGMGGALPQSEVDAALCRTTPEGAARLGIQCGQALGISPNGVTGQTGMFNSGLDKLGADFSWESLKVCLSGVYKDVCIQVVGGYVQGPVNYEDWVQNPSGARRVSLCTHITGLKTITTQQLNAGRFYVGGEIPPVAGSGSGRDLYTSVGLAGQTQGCVTQYPLPAPVDPGSSRVGWINWDGRYLNSTESPWNLFGLPTAFYSSPVPSQAEKLADIRKIEADRVAGTMDVTVECINGQNSQLVKVTKPVTIVNGQPFNVPDAECPPGWVAVGAGVDWTPDGGEKQEIVPRTPDQTPEKIKDEMIANPNCFNGSQQCVLELKMLTGNQLVSCGSIGQLCEDWAAHPRANDVYQCFYGGTRVNLNQCSAYRAPWIGILPNIDKDGNVIPYTAPPPPNIGGIIGPKPGPTTPAPDLRADCAGKKPPTFWDHFSPYWIYEGVRCALVDLFIPSPAVINAKAATVASSWAKTPPGVVIAFVNGMAQQLPSGTGCSGPHVAFGVDLGGRHLGYDGYPMSACSGSMATVANLARTIGALAMVVSCLTAITRYVGSVVNAPQLGKETSS